MSGRSLFRQAALERTSSPEQLDRLLTITDTRGWLALLASGMLLRFAVGLHCAAHPGPTQCRRGAGRA